MDLAPLAAFRILFGLLLVNWHWQLLPDVGAFFSDEGFLPRHRALLHYPDRFSLLHLMGDTWQVAAFVAAGAIVSGLVVVGMRTRLACIAAFMSVISIQNRDPLVLDGSDLVFRAAAFWLIFTAAGDKWSIDALIRRSRGDPPPATGPALPVRILQLQIAWIYLATGLEKLGGRRWLDGTATYYALQLEHTFGRSWAAPLVRIPELVRASTFGTIALELAFLPMVFFPFFRPWIPLLAVAGAAGLHLGIATLMNVGNFPVVMLVALVLYLPAAWVERAVAAAPWSANVGRTAQRVARLVEHWRWLRPAPHRRAAQRIATGLSASALVAIAAAAFASATPRTLGQPPGPVSSLRYAALDQRWDMFSPDPASSDGWISARGVLADGTRVELIGDNARPIPGDPIVVSEDQPIMPRYADPLYSRWAKVYERISNVSYAAYRLEFGRMFCRIRNVRLPEGASPLVSFEVRYFERTLQPPGRGAPIVTQHDIWSHAC